MHFKLIRGYIFSFRVKIRNKHLIHSTMKTAKMKFLFTLSVLAIAVACEKEAMIESDNPPSEAELLKSLETDTAISDIPDVVVEDSVLTDQALVSQYHENLLTYTYDRSGRLDYISYFRRCAITPASDVNLVPRYIFMRDKFIYNSSGQLAELQRFSLTEKPQICSMGIVKYYKYNSAGKLEQIITRRPNASYKWDRLEFLYYDQSGNLVRKLIRGANMLPVCLIYAYDKPGRLVSITCFINGFTRPGFVCNLFYDSFNNIERKEFYYPLPAATSVNDVFRKWVVYYKFDVYNNPFRNLKLPVGSLFEWMDLISPDNITAIMFDNGTVERMVHYKYRYNDAGYPVVRYRISPLAADE